MVVVVRGVHDGADEAVMYGEDVFFPFEASDGE